YHWDNGVIDNVAFISPIGNSTYVVTGVDANGCQNTDQADVFVNALPIVQAGPDQEVCEGIAVVFSGAGALNYVWTGGILDNVPFVNAVGQYEFIVSGTDLNMCSNTDTAQLIVNPNPIVNAGLDIMGCEGQSITLNAIGTGNISWNNGVVNGVPFVQNVGVTVYVVTEVLGTGCSASDSLIVQIHPNPSVSAEDREICEGEGVALNGSGANVYMWTHGVIDGVEFYPSESDDYMVEGNSIYGCADSFIVRVTVHPAPIIDFKILKPSMTTVDPSTGFDNLSVGAVSYQWDFGDGSPYSTEFEPYHTFPDAGSGNYEVVLTGYSEFGCPGEKIKYIYVLQDYTIYVPNSFTPDANGVNEIFKPILEGFDEDEYTLYIFNRWGEIIFESHDMQVGWDGKFGRNGREDVQDGVYTWKVEAGFIDSSDSKIFVGHVSLLK
ncbi:MAG: gliding motility-associated C-terminal domain-containing protein, partial [Crocinitomicaceae bacterium]|nr:gliding motility-associated C-terminal domain-containing protein [Crocinitomicaceae bacterium]